MNEPSIITSANNPIIKEIKGLKTKRDEPKRKPSYLREAGLCLMQFIVMRKLSI